MVAKGNKVWRRGADIGTQKHAHDTNEYASRTQMSPTPMWATAIIALINFFALSNGCPAQCPCGAWPNPCEVCTPAEKANHYICLGRGRNGGKQSCTAGNGGVSNVTCVWEDGQGSNFWSGGSNQCVIARSACCESSDSDGRCFQLGQPISSATSAKGVSNSHVSTWFTKFLFVLGLCIV